MAHRRCEACDELIAMRAQVCPHCDLSLATADRDVDHARIPPQPSPGLGFLTFCLISFAIIYAVVDFAG
ncbi:MAG: hypothetical protein P1U65_05125 [Minwuia sp.]|nr:hypothetical protein [Minwuia sp.]